MFRFLKSIFGWNRMPQSKKKPVAIAPYKLEPPEPTMIIFKGVKPVEDIAVNDKTVRK